MYPKLTWKGWLGLLKSVWIGINSKKKWSLSAGTEGVQCNRCTVWAPEELPKIDARLVQQTARRSSPADPTSCAPLRRWPEALHIHSSAAQEALRATCVSERVDSSIFSKCIYHLHGRGTGVSAMHCALCTCTCGCGPRRVPATSIGSTVVARLGSENTNKTLR